MAVVKVIRLVGNSGESWEDAASSALREASRTIRDIQGVEATDFTAQVQGGEITEYRCTVNIAFLVRGKDDMAGEAGSGRGESGRGGGGSSAGSRGGSSGGSMGSGRGGSAAGGSSGGGRGGASSGQPGGGVRGGSSGGGSAGGRGGSQSGGGRPQRGR